MQRAPRDAAQLCARVLRRNRTKTQSRNERPDRPAQRAAALGLGRRLPGPRDPTHPPQQPPPWASGAPYVQYPPPGAVPVVQMPVQYPPGNPYAAQFVPNAPMLYAVPPMMQMPPQPMEESSSSEEEEDDEEDEHDDFLTGATPPSSPRASATRHVKIRLKSKRRVRPRERQRIGTVGMCFNGPALVRRAVGWEPLGGRGATFRGSDRAAESGADSASVSQVASTASARRGAAATPSTWPHESPRAS